MSLKSSSLPSSPENTNRPSTLPEMKQPRSLRLRLMLWYGGLVVVLLGLFASLVLFFSTQTLYSNADQAINAVVRVSLSSIEHELSSDAPYWPATLTLKNIDIYKDPGVTIAVLNQQGKILYPRDSTSLSVLAYEKTRKDVQATGNSKGYVEIVDGERIKVEVVPIHAPGGGAVIGELLVAKSLKEVDETVVGLRVLIITLGVIVFGVALVGGWAITA